VWQFRTAVRRGPAYMMLASLAFTIMVASVKYLRHELSALEVLLWRASLSVPLAAILARGRILAVKARPLLAARVVLGFGAMACFFTAAAGLSLSDMSFLNKLQPVVIVLLAPVLLGTHERVGRGIFWVVALGLAGTALLLGPALAVGNRYGLWALGATLLSSGAHLAVRALRKHASAPAIVFWFQLGAACLALALLPLMLGRGPHWPKAALWPALVVCGGSATLGQVLMTRAYAVEKAGIVSAASYVAPVWGVAGDVVLFGVWPSATAWLGGGLIVAAGLWLLRHPVDAVAADGTMAMPPEAERVPPEVSYE
jgi:drug/metabolite transporter (DMT)-like permease